MSGPFLVLIDHILLKGGYFIFAQIVNPSLVNNIGYLAFGGVIVSYIMFIPFFYFVGIFGWWFSKRLQSNKVFRKRSETVETDGKTAKRGRT